MNSYKKIIISFLIFFVVSFSFLFYIIDFRKDLLLYNLDRVSLYVNKKFLYNNHIDFDILLIGDSKLKSMFNPILIKDKKIYNFALSDSFPINGYYFLKLYLEKHPNFKNKEIILSFGIEHFSFFKPSSFERLLEINYFDFDFNFYFKEYSFIKYNFPSYFKHSIFYFFDPLNWIINIFPMFYTPRDIISFNINYIEQNLGHRFVMNPFLNNKKLNHEAFLKKFKVLKINDYYLNKLIKLAKNNNIKIKFVFGPLNDTSEKFIRKNVLDDYYFYIKSFEKKYDNFSICNNIEFLPFYFFDDFNHIGKKGLKYVTYDIYNKCLKD